MKKVLITPHFTADEIRCKCGCESADIDLNFMLRVEKLREAYGKPMVVTSGVRCPRYNAIVGGSSNSYHMPTDTRKSMALDISINNSMDRHRFLKLALAEFNGVGIDGVYIHIDGRKSEARVAWVY